MQTIAMTPKALRYVAGHLSAEDNRPALGCLLVEGVSGRLVATDGHTLAVYCDRDGEYAAVLADPAPVLLRAQWAKLARAVKREEAITVPLPGMGETAPFVVHGKAFTVTREDWAYPNWRATFRTGPVAYHPPEPVPVGRVALTPALLARFYSEDGGVELSFTGEGRAMIVRTEDPDFLGLCMPRRAPGARDGEAERWADVLGLAAEVAHG